MVALTVLATEEHVLGRISGDCTLDLDRTVQLQLVGAALPWSP